jgi:cytochrome o ubiquinol oxidase subunit 2
MAKRIFTLLFLTLLFVATVVLSIHYIQTHNVPVLHPKGWIGIQQRDLLVISTLLMCIVVIPVFLMTAIFAWRYREGNEKATYKPNWAHSTLGEIVWWGVPFAIVVALGFITWDSTHKLNPYTPIASETPSMKIQVVALDWKWLFIYPELGIATVNYVQFPEKTPLSFEITADAPMNSFWIPQLGGQIYAMPAMRTKLHLIANETGKFRGSSANISGKGFAGMIFAAVSSTEEEFEAWVKSVQDSSEALNEEEYQILSRPSSYNPVQYYGDVEEGLFDQIVMKYMYMPPSAVEETSFVEEVKKEEPVFKRFSIRDVHK